MQLLFVPYKQVGEVLFEMPREKVRGLWGKYEEFQKSEFSENTTDAFGSIHVYYDKDDKVEAIECFGDHQLLFESEDLFHFSIDDYLKKFSDVKLEVDGLDIPSCGISCFIPDMQGTKKIESILMYKKGYFEEA